MKTILAFFLSFSTLANFSGKWSGDGVFETDRRDGECREVFLQLKQTEDFFYILDGGYICGDIQASYPPSQFMILQGELFYQGHVVGKISQNEIILTYLEGVYKLKLRIVGEEIHFNESWIEGDDFLLINSKMEALP
ncbi:hypothetical protein A9Q84_19535 [Halobacteriovorax marinus]|uniref:Uncharacterized protein n=1 Tax=Halobacteriovorax marinus TaxID=97084 RepID=A0A1Y5F914_9BACT|nr:hypothetical protein A9Q84_19535 [Halobacteriovorax marinus]